MENKKDNKKVYLITTKDISVSFFEYYELKSRSNRLIADDTFWKFLTKKGCLFPAVWKKIMQSNKESEDIELFKGIMRETSYAETDDSADTYFDVVNITGDSEESTISSKNKHDIFINALVDCFADNEKERNVYKKLIGDIQQVEDTNIFITHNWYGCSNGALGKCRGYIDNLKYEFVELLITFLEKQFDEEIDLHLIVHDKDLLSKGQVDSILAMSDLPDIRSYKKLHDLVSKEKVYVFQHSVQNEFYPEILNAKDKLSQELLVQSIGRFFQYYIPPTIINGKEYIEINISHEATSKHRYCATREIIDAIAEFQSGGNFLLKRVLVEHNGYGEAVKSMDNNKPVIVRGERTLSELKLNDKRASFLDSSIWLRYTTNSDKTCNILNEYYDLYKTANARETREFRARLCRNSYLQSFEGGHYRDVTPFLFHSETEMEGKTEEIILEMKDYTHNRVIPQWRFLLVDDNAFNNDTDAAIQKCKVITDILGKDFCIVCMNKDNCLCPDQGWCTTCDSNSDNRTIFIDCVRTIQESHKKLKERRYDVVLLDYLLGGVNNSREYGTDLLSELKKQYEEKSRNENGMFREETDRINQYKKAKGPFEKFWIFFVSAFSNAISEKMLSEGMHYNTDYWYIARGACPTTTPELFRYNLHSLLYQQIINITDVCVVKSTDDFSEFGRRIITLIDLLSHIFIDLTSTRDKAMKNFNSFLHLRAHYDILKKDYFMGGKENPDAKPNGSPLVQALFPDIEHYSNAFWEHVQHLIYLVAFGNIRQWNEMWDEYIFIKDILCKAEGKARGEDNVVRKIEKYIIEIKNANYR